MDTISRENNSMLPVGGIIVGVIALLLGGFAAVQASKANKAIAEHQPKIDKIDGIETQAASASAAAEKASRELAARMREVQDGFNTIGPEISRLSGAVTKLEEAQKKPVAAAGKKGGEAVVAGPGEYVVKAGDVSGAKIARDHGVSLADLQAVNPGVNWSSLKVGVTKLKMPSTAKK
jgi:LysM repeat protein